MKSVCKLGCKLFAVEFENEMDYIEADSYQAALGIWQEYMFVEQDCEEDETPDSITLISDSPVISQVFPEASDPSYTCKTD